MAQKSKKCLGVFPCLGANKSGDNRESFADMRKHTSREAKKKAGRTRGDEVFHEYVVHLTESTFFTAFITFVIFVNALTIAFEVEDVTAQSILPLTRQGSINAYAVLNEVFLGIFTWEFIMKIYAYPKGYWLNGFNIFDFVVLVVSYIQPVMRALDMDDAAKTGHFVMFRMLRACRTLRVLRTVSMFRGLQVLVTALIDTIRNSVLNVVLLLLLVVFLFGIMGHYFFGVGSSAKLEEHWGSLNAAMLTLFTFVTVDSWTERQKDLDEEASKASRFFTITFIFVGHFILTNVFVAVIIMNISEATEHHKAQKATERKLLVQAKKRYMMERQHTDVERMLAKQRIADHSDFQEMFREFEQHLRHDDYTGMSDISTNLLWISIFRKQIEHMDNTTYRVEQLQFEIANVLAQLLQLRLEQEEREMEADAAEESDI